MQILSVELEVLTRIFILDFYLAVVVSHTIDPHTLVEAQCGIGCAEGIVAAGDNDIITLFTI